MNEINKNQSLGGNYFVNRSMYDPRSTNLPTAKANFSPKCYLVVENPRISPIFFGVEQQR